MYTETRTKTVTPSAPQTAPATATRIRCPCLINTDVGQSSKASSAISPGTRGSASARNSVRCGPGFQYSGSSADSRRITARNCPSVM